MAPLFLAAHSSHRAQPTADLAAEFRHTHDWNNSVNPNDILWPSGIRENLTNPRNIILAPRPKSICSAGSLLFSRSRAPSIGCAALARSAHFGLGSVRVVAAAAAATEAAKTWPILICMLILAPFFSRASLAANFACRSSHSSLLLLSPPHRLLAFPVLLGRTKLNELRATMTKAARRRFKKVTCRHPPDTRENHFSPLSRVSRLIVSIEARKEAGAELCALCNLRQMPFERLLLLRIRRRRRAVCRYRFGPAPPLSWP